VVGRQRAYSSDEVLNEVSLVLCHQEPRHAGERASERASEGGREGGNQ
jgi:hypothetical protein